MLERLRAWRLPVLPGATRPGDLSTRNTCGRRLVGSTPKPPSHPLQRPAQARDTGFHAEYAVFLLAKNQTRQSLFGCRTLVL